MVMRALINVGDPPLFFGLLFREKCLLFLHALPSFFAFFQIGASGLFIDDTDESNAVVAQGLAKFRLGEFFNERNVGILGPAFRRESLIRRRIGCDEEQVDFMERGEEFLPDQGFVGHIE
jgi:hypothetical protein